MSENRAVWKSNNQGVKETLIWTDRRVRDGQAGWKGLTAGGSWKTGTGRAVAG